MKPKLNYFIAIVTGLTLLIALIFLCGIVRADDTNDINIEKLVNSIYKAEGGAKAQYKYGIRSISYKDEAEARRICFNTVRNNIKRYNDYGYKKYDTYLEFLPSRYCPVGADNDPQGLNQHWLKNVKYFYERSK